MKSTTAKFTVGAFGLAVSLSAAANELYCTVSSASKYWGDPDPAITVTVNSNTAVVGNPSLSGYNTYKLTNFVTRAEGELPGSYDYGLRDKAFKKKQFDTEFWWSVDPVMGVPVELTNGSTTNSFTAHFTNAVFTILKKPIDVTVYGMSRSVPYTGETYLEDKWFRSESNDSRFEASKVKYTGAKATRSTTGRTSYALSVTNFTYDSKFYDCTVTLGGQGYFIVRGPECSTISTPIELPSTNDIAQWCAKRTGITMCGVYRGAMAYRYDELGDLLSFPSCHPSFTADQTLMADNFYDNETRVALLNPYGISVMDYAKMSYSNFAETQVFRAVAERLSAEYSGTLSVNAAAVHWNPALVPCKAPGATVEAFEAPAITPSLSDQIPVAGAMFRFDHMGTQVVDFLNAACINLPNGFNLPAATLSSYAALDSAKSSYAIPYVGIGVHTNDYVNCLVRFVNCLGTVATESTQIGGLSTAEENALTSWEGFVPAFRSLKVHAYRLGYDFGTDGVFASYVSSEATSSVKITQLTANKELPPSALTLLTVYKASQSAEGTSSDNAAYTAIRSWCDSSSVGRKVL